MVVNSLRGRLRGRGLGDMNKIWFAAAALVAALASGSAFAADLPPAPQVYAPRPALAPPIYSWTGCYLGIEGGGAWGQSQHSQAGTVPNPANDGRSITGDFTVSGGLFGGTVGCNYQVNNVAFGIENDLSWTNISGIASDIPPFNTAATSSTHRDLARHSAWPRRPRVGSSLFLRHRGRRLCECWCTSLRADDLRQRLADQDRMGGRYWRRVGGLDRSRRGP